MARPRARSVDSIRQKKLTMEERLSTDSALWRVLSEIGGFDEALVTEFEQIIEQKWMPIGEVMLREGMLRMREVMALLGIQADEPGQRFGDLAIREGFCTQEQVGKALRIQRETCPHPLELLMRDQRLDQTSLFDGMVEYARYLEGRVRSLERRLELAGSSDQGD